MCVCNQNISYSERTAQTELENKKKQIIKKKEEGNQNDSFFHVHNLRYLKTI